MTSEEKILQLVDEVIKETNKKFIETVMAKNKSKEKIMFEFFREKYIHYLLYSNFSSNQEFKKLGYHIEAEAATHLKFIVTGNYPKSGRHDIIIRDEKGKPVVGFEIFLGYDKDNKTLNSRSFIAHLEKDHMKLTKDPNLKHAYLLNYFYKGRSKRVGLERTKRKEKSYQDHLLKCKKRMEKMVKDPVELKRSMELSIWLVEARDDDKTALGQLKI